MERGRTARYNAYTWTQRPLGFSLTAWGQRRQSRDLSDHIHFITKGTWMILEALPSPYLSFLAAGWCSKLKFLSSLPQAMLLSNGQWLAFLTVACVWDLRLLPCAHLWGYSFHFRQACSTPRCIIKLNISTTFRLVQWLKPPCLMSLDCRADIF